MIFCHVMAKICHGGGSCTVVFWPFSEVGRCFFRQLSGAHEKIAGYFNFAGFASCTAISALLISKKIMFQYKEIILSKVSALAAKRISYGVYCWSVTTQKILPCSMVLIYLHLVVPS
jgi:hypothetical protein